MVKFKPCSTCSDPTYCVSILEECENDAVAKLEDERQSEAFYETYLDDKQYEMEQLKHDIEDEKNME
jgi:hypothetical protein